MKSYPAIWRAPSSRAPFGAVALLTLAGMLAAGGPVRAQAPRVNAEGQGSGGVVRARFTGEPVVDLLVPLSKTARMDLRATDDLGERRLHLLVEELPEPKVRKALAAVTGGVWRRKQQDSYLLEPDPAVLREQARLAQGNAGRFFKGLTLLVDGLKLDEKGRAQLEKTNPAAAYFLGQPQHRTAIELTTLLGDRERAELAASGHVTVPAERLGPRGGELIRQYLAQSMDVNVPGLPPRAPNAPPLDPEKVSRGPVYFTVLPGETSEPFGYLRVELHGARDLPAAVISGSVAPGGPSTRWIEPGGSSGDRLPEKPGARVRFMRPPGSWGAALQAIADQMEIPAVSQDYTRVMPIPGFLIPAEVTGSVAEVLDRLCAIFGYQWRFEDGIYRFRSMGWYIDPVQEPPGTLVKAVYTAREKKESLSLDWAARAASLSPAQQDRLLIHAPGARTILRSDQEVLRFYNALQPAQRTTLAGEKGLAAGDLTKEQQPAFLAAVQAVARDWTPEAVAQSKVRLAGRGGLPRFIFESAGRTAETAIPLPSALPAFRP